ncbi:MAG: hypothetical protein QM687_09685 [Ferruginibacter sp.]
MKKAIILLLSVSVTVMGASAQRKKDSIVISNKIVPVKTAVTVPVTTTTAAPATTTNQTKATPPSTPATTTPVKTDADYFLAGAIVKVSTGSDNKEASNSSAGFYVRPRRSDNFITYRLENYLNELKVNQTTDLRLDRATDLTNNKNSLQYFKQNGLAVEIIYCNRIFCTDAWKINGITVVLEFKDSQGNPAPNGFASKTISFPVSSGTLGFVAGCNPFWVSNTSGCGYSDQLQKMLLKTDEYFQPLPNKLLYYYNNDFN